MSTRRYAENTEVSSEKTRTEIESVLRRYGADSFMYGWDQNRAVVGFRMNSRMIRMELSMPTRDDFRTTETGRSRKSAETVTAAWEQECRRRWRALALVIKAKLEAVESGIAEFESEFLAYIVLPDNSTVGQRMLPQIDHTYRTGNMPPMLPPAMGEVER